MKQYVIDELRPDDYSALKDYFDAHYENARLEGIYWLPLEARIFNEAQRGHKDCQPFYFAVVLSPTALTCELLVRTNAAIKCTCMGYADELQRNWLITKIDAILDDCDIMI